MAGGATCGAHVAQQRFATRPLYLQVRDFLAERIARGEWKPGAAIPNEGDLAREFGISTGTIRKALDLLEMANKRDDERKELRDKITELVKDHGLSVQDLFGGKRGKGSVAIKYRDPKNPENTWAGRGRMPRWLAAATRGGKAKKEDFLV